MVCIKLYNKYTKNTNLTRALSIERNLTEPMKQLLDDGVIL